MNDDKFKSIVKTVAIILAIGVIIYLCLGYESNDYVSMTETEKLQSENEELEKENRRYEEKIIHLNSQVEELENELKEVEEYNDMLIEQLKRNGIEPVEL